MTDLKPEDRALIERLFGPQWLKSGQGTVTPGGLSLLLEAARAEGLRSPSGGGERLSVALAKAGYLMSEPHLSGHRVVLGFDTLDDAQAAHVGIADAILRARAAPPSREA